MKIQSEEVKIYFKNKAKEFDDIYENSGGLIKIISNKLFRTGMAERFDLTIKSCVDLKNKKKARDILDIGCGAGRFAFPLERAGLSVYGIDYSSEMIDLANLYLKRYKQKINRIPKIKFEVSDFIKDFDKKRHYDITLALGVFDYVKYPLFFIKKIKDITKKAIIMSFPKKITPQMPIRKLWLLLRHCPVYFYTLNEVKKILEQSKIKNYKIWEVSAGYQVLAYMSAN